MQITQDHLDFIAARIADGEDAGADAVRVDVAAIGERFGLTWPAARDLLQSAAKQLGHKMAGPKSAIVARSQRRTISDATGAPEIRGALTAVEALMALIDGESARIVPKS